MSCRSFSTIEEEEGGTDAFNLTRLTGTEIKSKLERTTVKELFYYIFMKFKSDSPILCTISRHIQGTCSFLARRIFKLMSFIFFRQMQQGIPSTNTPPPELSRNPSISPCLLKMVSKQGAWCSAAERQSVGQSSCDTSKSNNYWTKY